jgi:hypothetical protein
MAMLDAYADLFTDEYANQSGITPANLANPANNRSTASPPVVANACESLRIAPETGQTDTRFADIRSDSQTAKTAPECARSQDSQDSQGGNGETFAESTIEPALMNVIRKYCRRTTRTDQNYQEGVDYFTELVGQGHADMVRRACTEPPVYLVSMTSPADDERPRVYYSRQGFRAGCHTK